MWNVKKKTFCGFSMGSNQYWAGRVYDLCVCYMTGTPEGSTESDFMEKPGIFNHKTPFYNLLNQTKINEQTKQNKMVIKNNERL